MITLDIPRLGRAPRTWTLHEANPVAARIALGLLDASHIPPTPLVSTPGNLIETGLKRWLDTQTAKLRVFSFSLQYSDWPHRAQHEHAAESASGAAVYLSTIHAPKIVIGKRLAEIERSAPGLGETVLSWIDEAAARRILVYSPPCAFRVCSWWQWQGFLDESERLEEIKLAGETPEDYEILTRKAWDAAMPTWASLPKRRLSLAAIERLAHPRRTTLPDKVARALLALHETLKAAPVFDDEDTPQIQWGCWLRWSDKDLSDRAWDDYANDVYQSGEYREHISWFEHIDNDEIGPQLTAWLDHLAPFFTFVRALDELIVLLAPSPRTLYEAFRGYGDE